MSYCERMLELLTDLEAQLPTRRFFNTLLDSSHFIVSHLPFKYCRIPWIIWSLNTLFCIAFESPIDSRASCCHLPHETVINHIMYLTSLMLPPTCICTGAGKVFSVQPGKERARGPPVQASESYM